MLRSYRYRLYPTAAQACKLETWLRLTRELYNAALQHRRDAWEKGVRVSLYDQMHALAEIREVRPEFDAVPIVVLRGALRRLDRAFSGFFLRCKRGQKPGYPRFRGRGQFESILIDDVPRDPIAGREVKIPLLGRIRFKQHRPLDGAAKATRLKRDAAGRWFVTLACDDVQVKTLNSTCKDVGIDLGLSTFVATSDGEMFENPRTLASARIGLERAQRVVSRRCRGSRRRDKSRILFAKKHAHVAAVRRENHIHIARALVARYDTIYVEDLNVRGLARGQLAKAVNDAGWVCFLGWLRTKAEEAGREVVSVNPRGTSQICSGCGCEVRKSLTIRIHECPHCGLVLDRDVNAARNILGLGRSLRREAPAVSGPL